MRNLYFLILLSIFAIPVFGQTLIFQFSDTHSIYSNMRNFTYKIQNRIDDFKTHYPDGEVLFIHSGDISGPSEFTYFDRGNLNYDRKK